MEVDLMILHVGSESSSEALCSDSLVYCRVDPYMVKAELAKSMLNIRSDQSA